MKSKELQLQLIDRLDHVVAAVEAIVIDNEDITRFKIDSLKSDLHNLLHTVIEIEKSELDTPENSMQKMKHSVEDLKRKLSVLSVSDEPQAEPAPANTKEAAPEEPATTEPEAEILPERSTLETAEAEVEENPIEPEPEAEILPGNPIADTTETVSEEPEAAEPENGIEPEATIEPENEPEPQPEPEEEPEPQPVPEPDLSDFIARPDEVPTSYVTSLTAMAQAQAGEQDMSQVAVFSTAMPDEKVVRQVEQRSDIFSKLKETEQLPFANGQSNLKSLVERLKTSKTVNDMDYRPTSDNIRAYIGINEKFLFINELFKGNIKEYGEMIQALDEAKDEQEMNHVLLPLREKYTWNEQSLSYITLSDILKKKFGCAPQSLQA